jgi:DNA-binding NtrC family response regulator
MQAPSSLVISYDAAISAQLQACLELDHGCRVQLATSYQDAAGKIQRDGLQSVFIDLRPELSGHDPAPVLRQLSSLRECQIPVIVIADPDRHAQWAEGADSSIVGRLDLPLDRQQISNLLLANRGPLMAEKIPVLEARQRPDKFRVIQGESLKFTTYCQDLFPMLDRLEFVAGHNVTLLLVGETGSGKTTLARLVHELSPRRQERFLTVACGALPMDLIESELFGHVKGAFTGAERTKVGRFEAAEGGTLLLDEIDVLGPKEQSKLLRVIETGEFEPVGSTETRKTDTRLVAASNVDLRTMMSKNAFRPDLYYRLNVLEFLIPPLRKRTMDIVPLALDFISEFSATHNIPIHRIHPEFLELLVTYDWPGNIRELKNHMRRAVLFSSGGELSPKDLLVHGGHTSEKPAAVSIPHAIGTPLTRTLAEKVASTEQELLEQALQANNYKRTVTAKALGISRVGLYKKMKKYGMLDKLPPEDADTNGYLPPANGHAANGHAGNGHSSNGHTGNGQSANGHVPGALNGHHPTNGERAAS